MDVISFLKIVPAVIGIAGLLTYFMRAEKPVSDHGFVNFLLGGRSTLLLLGSAALIMLSAWLILRPAPPDHDVRPEWGAGGRDGLIARTVSPSLISTLAIRPLPDPKPRL